MQLASLGRRVGGGIDAQRQKSHDDNGKAVGGRVECRVGRQRDVIEGIRACKRANPKRLDRQ